MCDTCNDTGIEQVTCPSCNGSGEGQFDGSMCLVCHNSGVVYEFCKDCEEGNRQRRESWR